MHTEKLMTINRITFKDSDEFKRKEIANKIITLLKSTIDVSPLVIDGDWGTGKTEFTYKLINLFEEEKETEKELEQLLATVGEKDNKPEIVNYNLVYIDAYKADHADEPLMTILAAIIKSYPDIQEKKQLREKAKTALKFGSKTVLKAGVNWILRQDSTNVANDFDGAIKEVLDKSIDNILSIHEKSEENIKALVEVLEKITKTNPMIIFIDELDRCRPNFAVKMLENIKHIFAINNLQFVLVANLNQIRSSIKHCYGEPVDSQSYLDKFLGFTFSLPQTIPRTNQKNVSCDHFDGLLNGSIYLNNTDLIQSGYIEFFETLIKVNRLTLRQVETFIKYLNIYQIISNNDLSKKKNFGVMLLRIFGTYIFCFEPNSVENINQGIVDAIKLNNIFGKNGLFNIRDQSSEVYCENTDKIAYVIYRESNINKLEFGNLEEGDEELWNNSIGSMFDSWETRLTAIEQIKFVINRLQLGVKA